MYDNDKELKYIEEIRNSIRACAYCTPCIWGTFGKRYFTFDVCRKHTEKYDLSYSPEGIGAGAIGRGPLLFLSKQAQGWCMVGIEKSCELIRQDQAEQ